jgi:hypothetical protein
MHKREIEWRIANLNRQVQEHLQNEKRLAEYPNSVYVEKTMRECAEKQIANLQAQLNT